MAEQNELTPAEEEALREVAILLWQESELKVACLMFNQVNLPQPVHLFAVGAMW